MCRLSKQTITMHQVSKCAEKNWHKKLFLDLSVTVHVHFQHFNSILNFETKLTPTFAKAFLYLVSIYRNTMCINFNSIPQKLSDYFVTQVCVYRQMDKRRDRWTDSYKDSNIPIFTSVWGI